MTDEQRRLAEEALVEHWCEAVDIKVLIQAYYSDQMDYLSGIGDAELAELLESNEIIL